MLNDRKYLHPELNKRLESIIASHMEQSYDMQIVETLRSKAEQNYLYSMGRTAPGDLVTTKTYPNDYHCWGLAVTVTTNNSRIISNCARRLGLDIHRMKDGKFILEYKLKPLKELSSVYGDYENFSKTWTASQSPTRNYEVDSITMMSAQKNVSYIKAIQQACIIDGYRTTNNAVLKATSVLDDDTMYALQKINLTLNDKGVIIKQVQKMLLETGENVKVTGVFDNETSIALRAFKSKNNLVADNVINGNTIIYLISRT